MENEAIVYDDDEATAMIKAVDRWVGWHDGLEYGSLLETSSHRFVLFGLDFKGLIEMPYEQAISLYRSGKLRELVETEVAIHKMKQ